MYMGSYLEWPYMLAPINQPISRMMTDSNLVVMPGKHCKAEKGSPAWRGKEESRLNGHSHRSTASSLKCDQHNSCPGSTMCHHSFHQCRAGAQLCGGHLQHYPLDETGLLCPLQRWSQVSLLRRRGHGNDALPHANFSQNTSHAYRPWDAALPFSIITLIVRTEAESLCTSFCSDKFCEYFLLADV